MIEVSLPVTRTRTVAIKLAETLKKNQSKENHRSLLEIILERKGQKIKQRPWEFGALKTTPAPERKTITDQSPYGEDPIAEKIRLKARSLFSGDFWWKN